MTERETLLQFKVIALRNLFFEAVDIVPTEKDVDKLDNAATSLAEEYIAKMGD